MLLLLSKAGSLNFPQKVSERELARALLDVR